MNSHSEKYDDAVRSGGVRSSLVRCLLFLIPAMPVCCPAYAVELRLLSDTSETWHARPAPQPPETDRETLAVRSAAAEATVSEGRLTAYYLGQRNSLDLVTVEEAPEEGAEDVHSINSYLIRSGTIRSDTRIKFVTKPKPEFEQIARDTAQDFLAGKVDPVPVIYNNLVYVAGTDGKCIVTVQAKDDVTVHYTFRFSTCSKFP